MTQTSPKFIKISNYSYLAILLTIFIFIALSSEAAGI